MILTPNSKKAKQNLNGKNLDTSESEICRNAKQTFDTCVNQSGSPVQNNARMRRIYDRFRPQFPSKMATLSSSEDTLDLRESQKQRRKEKTHTCLVALL
jgi:hypothetical protein